MKDGSKRAQFIPKVITLLLTLLLAFIATFFTIALAWKPMSTDSLRLLIPQLAGAGQNVSNTSLYDSKRPAMAIDGGTIYLAWTEEESPTEIFFNKKVSGSWSGNVNVSNNIHDSAVPAIAVTGDDVHLVWQDDRFGNYEIVYNQSLNGGGIWGSPELIPDGGSDCLVPPAITLSGAVPHVVWGEDQPSGLEIFYSNRAGGLWPNPPKNLTTSTAGDADHPSIGAGNHLHAPWDVDSATGDFIEYSRSTDGGANWSAPVDISSGLTSNKDSTHPDIAVQGDTVFVVWSTFIQQVDSDYTYAIRFNKSTNGGADWLSSSIPIATPTLRLGFMTHFPVPRVAISDTNHIYVVWHRGPANADVMCSSSEDGGVTWSLAPDNVSSSSENAQLARVAVGSTTQVVWEEQVNGLYDIFHNATTGTEESGGIYLPIIMKNH